MNKQYLPYCAAFLLAFLIIAPSMVAACVSEDKYQNITVSDAKMMLENVSVSGENIFILDVRTPAEYSYSHIEGAKLITLRNVPAHDPVPLPDSQLLPSRMKELPKNKLTKIVVYCYTGKRGGEASQLIANAGYKRVYNIQNGLPTWVNAGYPVVMDPAKWGTSYPHYL